MDLDCIRWRVWGERDWAGRLVGVPFRAVPSEHGVPCHATHIMPRNATSRRAMTPVLC